jgi:hypothetical protein
MKYETRTEDTGKVVLQLGLTHEAGFPVEPDIDTIVNGVQLLVEAVCGISVFELTRAVIDEYVRNGRPPEGWEAPVEEPTEGEESIDEQPVS